jgi:hypothetical protein
MPGCWFGDSEENEPEIQIVGISNEKRMEKKELRPDLRENTLCLHLDRQLEPNNSDVAPPIHVSTTYVLENDEGVVYSRDNQVSSWFSFSFFFVFFPQ